MPKLPHYRSLIALALANQLLYPPAVSAQLSEGAKAAILINNRYSVFPDQIYSRAGNSDLKLDVFQPQSSKSSIPVVIYIHGGGWGTGTKAEEMLWLLPYLQAGWAGINIEYRLTSNAPAPAAVEDCRCALRWVGRNALQYNLDVKKIVVTGASAGGHLALMTALVPDGAGFDNRCLVDDDQPWSGNIREAPKIVAVINWFGPTDLTGMIREHRSYAVSWLSSPVNQAELAKRVSPITYVRPGSPPVLTIHGDLDQLVPYTDSVRFHQALEKAGVTNELITVAGARHGEFSDEETLKAYDAIQRFLRKLGVAPEISK